MFARRFSFVVVIALCGLAITARAQAAGNGPTAVYPSWFTNNPDLVHRTNLSDSYPGLAEYLSRLDAEQSVATTETGSDIAAVYPSWFTSNIDLVHRTNLSDSYPGLAAYLSRINLPADLTAGTWRLVDYAIISRDGSVHHPLGTDASGYLIISPERYAAVTIAPSSKSAGTFISYAGKLDYQGDKSIYPFVSLDPNLVGVDQVKTWQLSGNQLILTTPSKDNGDIGRLVWELVK
jgi:Lipocalin-like domain